MNYELSGRIKIISTSFSVFQFCIASVLLAVLIYYILNIEIS